MIPEREMPPKQTKAAGNFNNKELLGREIRRNRLTLFIQQFEKEAQERLNDLEAKMENLLATVDKVFRVELMKMPPSLQSTLVGDILSESEVSASEVSIAMKNESREMSQPLRRMPSRKVKAIDSPVAATSAQSLSFKTPKVVKAPERSRTLVASASTGNLVRSTTAAKRGQARSTCRKMTDQAIPNQNVYKLRSVVSAGDLPCSMSRSSAHVTVTTARGETVSFSEETKDKINWELLDDVAWCQIQKLAGLMEYLSQQSRCQR
ncbi:borealin-2 isoform X1 [Oryzias melastigma]|uniref:Borealin-2-like n=2 Tax=Oryzias melastigma TaxID=30732 RepID=A0A3B3D852_ORYME|nr:borealin-2 isoform X1 [Oryzias melastigma]